MSVLAACGDKNEWICAQCAKCSICCTCEKQNLVHINTLAAAQALGRYARERRARLLSNTEPDGGPVV